MILRTPSHTLGCADYPRKFIAVNLDNNDGIECTVVPWATRSPHTLTFLFSLFFCSCCPLNLYPHNTPLQNRHFFHSHSMVRDQSYWLFFFTFIIFCFATLLYPKKKIKNTNREKKLKNNNMCNELTEYNERRSTLLFIFFWFFTIDKPTSRVALSNYPVYIYIYMHVQINALCAIAQNMYKKIKTKK